MPNATDERLDAFMAQMPKYNSADPLTCFFYLLMRDHLPVGIVTKLVAESSSGSSSADGSQFTNGHLAQFAELCSQEVQRKLMRKS